MGDKAPPLVLTNQQNASQSFSFPYQSKLVLIHFWSSSVSRSKPFLPRIYDLYERYSGVTFRNAEGFEVLTVAIQSDKTAWAQDIKEQGIDKLLNTIVVKGYNDMYIKTFKINQLSVTMLIDENGVILAINPTQLQLEDILDGKKNSPPNTKDIKGRLLFSENTSDVVKNQKMVLLNKFRDTLTRTVSDNAGQFSFHDVKLLNEYILEIDTTNSMTGKSKICLAAFNGPVFSAATKTNRHLEFILYPIDVNKLTGGIATAAGAKSAISFNANISFKKGTAELEP
ncbi:MAG: TlpA family protein disulfide reductase, partial [Bacteroidia bacterium]